MMLKLLTVQYELIKMSERNSVILRNKIKLIVKRVLDTKKGTHGPYNRYFKDNVVGGCTCTDETGGCSYGESSCDCDAGAGGNTNKESGKSHGCGGGSGGEGGGGGGGGSCGEKKDGKCVKPEPKFCSENVRKILKNVLLELLDNTYNEILCENLSQKAVSCVRKQVKELKFDGRYKFVCTITVAERGQHNLPVITRTLWDPESDACACFSHRTCTTMAIIQCFGLICEQCGSVCK